MGNQLTGIAPSQILPVEQYLTDVPDYEYDCSLGSTRFFKVARSVAKEGLSVVKVFVIHDPSLPLSSHRTQLEDIHKRLKETSNCLAFQKAVQSDKSALLFRQYVKDSLYDRISTRPFLNKIEKKWIAFQLLCALNQCHKVKVCHGDIKSENVMVTGWNWLLLTDFASFKPTYLPEDNPSDFSYFFDTSRRRTCYISPERFVASTWHNADNTQVGNLDLTSNEVKTGDLTPAMDIFSAGCVIAEMFTEGTPPFDLSQLLSYRNGEYSPWKVLSKIDDIHVRELVQHMLHKDPSYRLSAEEYLIKQRGKAFPECFYTFLKLHIQRFASPPILTPDDRITRLNKDMEMILKNLNIEREQSESNNVLVLIISLVCSSCRKLHFCNSKLIALSLLLDLSMYVTPDVTLDRVIPYMLHFADDPFPQVRAETIRTITQCLSNIKSVPHTDANVFPEYIFPQLSHLTQDTVALVRAAYAENIAQLADAALSVLEMMQLSDSSDEENQDDTEDITVQQSSYDMELQALQETIQQKVVMLLSDPENIVKQTLLENGITRLCVFFGRQKANDVLLSHMITFLNYKEDWQLRGSFFDNIVGVAAYVGWQSSSILKPLLQQGLNDPEEFVVHKSLGALKSLTELGLLQKSMLHDFVQDVVAYLAHPNVWIRQAAVGFISSVARILNIADIHCDLLPSLQPFLKQQILQVDKEVLLLNALQEAVPRSVFDYILRSSLIERLFDNLHNRNYMRSISRHGHKPVYPELDENMSQIFRKLSSLGMTESHEDRILAMKDYILKLHRIRAGSAESSSQGDDGSRQGKVSIVSRSRAITRRHADLYKPKDIKAESENIASNRRKKKNVAAETAEMNAEWKSMFGSNSSERSLSSSPKSKGSVKSESTDKKSLSVSGSSQSSTGSIVNVTSTESLVKMSNIQLPDKHTSHSRYAPCRIELKNLVHKCRDQYSASISSKDLLDSIAWDSHSPPNNWKPKGMLVAHLEEHRAAINRIQVSQDNNYFATASNDGTIKLWECGRLEGKSVANRSKCTVKQGGKVKTVSFLEGTQSTTMASSSDSGSINLYRIDAGKASLFLKQDLDLAEHGQVVDLSHFDTGSQSVLAYATVYGYLIGWDLRSSEIAWKLKNDPKTGLIQSFAVHHSQCWLSLGTSSGTHVCWDLRFQLPITSIQHPTGARVHRVIAHPQEQSWTVSATHGNNEVSMWDVETGARQKVLWASTAPALSQTQASNHAIHGMHISVTDSSVFLLTGGTDMRVRFWDLSYPANSFIMAGAAGDPAHQTSVSYRPRLIDGTEVIQETYMKKQVTNEDIPRRGPDAPPQGHHDVVSDVSLCQASQWLVITASRDGVVKVWK